MSVHPADHAGHPLMGSVDGLDGSLVFLLDNASAASLSLPGVWTIVNCHQSVFSFILPALGSQRQPRTGLQAHIPRICDRGHVELLAAHCVVLGIMQPPGHSCGLTLYGE
jgi:hypothetical protein